MQSRIEQVQRAAQVEAPDMVVHRLPRWEVGWEITPGTARAQHGEDGIEDAAQRVGPWSAASWHRRKKALQAFPLRVSQIARVRRVHAGKRTTLRHGVPFQNTLS